jgi:curli biogenesis system outer membrane secretion channel CsgG
MRASTIVVVALSALCLVAMVSAAAKPAQLNIKQQIALRAIQQQNNTDTISGIIDGISVRATFIVLYERI